MQQHHIVFLLIRGNSETSRETYITNFVESDLILI